MNGQNEKQGGLNWSAPQNAANKPFVPAAKTVPPPVAAPANGSGSTAKIVGWLAVGVVVGVVIAWGAASLFTRGSQPRINDALQSATSTTASTPATTAEVSSTLVVPTPQQAGLSVTIKSASVSAPTWVAVYESRDGKPSNVLGAALFSAGQSSGTVELLRATLPGQTYFVTEQTDSGNRQYSLTDPLVTLGGQPMWISFTAN